VARAVPLIAPTAAYVTAPIAVQASANELGTRKQQELQAVNALQKKEDLAWAAFYSAPASCEHQPSWKDRVSNAVANAGTPIFRPAREAEKGG
jgi:hypothetical protein